MNRMLSSILVEQSDLTLSSSDKIDRHSENSTTRHADRRGFGLDLSVSVFPRPFVTRAIDACARLTWFVIGNFDRERESFRSRIEDK